MKSNNDSINQLIEKLCCLDETATLVQRMQLVANHPILRANFERHVFPDPSCYHRKEIKTNTDFQPLILTWMPGQKSKIHNHRGSQCIVRVLQGTAIETVYNPLADRTFTTEIQHYQTGSVFGGEDADIHTLENPSHAKENLVTLHIYIPALENMELFGIVDGRLVPIEG